MAIAELAVETRTETGKGIARRLRRQGKIPAVRYGSQCPQTMYAVDRMAVERLLVENAGALVALNVDGKGVEDELLSIIKDTQIDPVTGWLIHVDFYGVRYGEPIQVELPVVLEGKPVGVAEGGLLQPVRRTLEVKCLPRQIPENIVIDVTNLGIGDAIHVNDLDIEGLEFIAPVNFTIVTVQNVSGGAEVTDEGEEELEEVEAPVE
ncbi:MAG: 50S ribosomal protein L25 [Deltaproteobacteria bacterium]|nr:50S ribosomal protein L25 [Deltaproteobacteria bacterium]